jgi:hypothetical protein
MALQGQGGGGVGAEGHPQSVRKRRREKRARRGFEAGGSDRGNGARPCGAEGGLGQLRWHMEERRELGVTPTFYKNKILCK